MPKQFSDLEVGEPFFFNIDDIFPYFKIAPVSELGSNCFYEESSGYVVFLRFKSYEMVMSPKEFVRSGGKLDFCMDHIRNGRLGSFTDDIVP